MLIKDIINSILKQKWLDSSDEEKNIWKQWQIWDSLRFKRDRMIYDAKQSQTTSSHDHNATKSQNEGNGFSRKADEINNDNSQKSTFHIPKKKRLIS